MWYAGGMWAWLGCRDGSIDGVLARCYTFGVVTSSKALVTHIVAGFLEMRARRIMVCALVAAVASVAACGDGPLQVAAPRALLGVYALTPATIRELTVEVSGPGIDPAQFVNLPVDTAGVAAGIIETTAGSARRIVVTAVDTAGIPTHRGDTTLALMPGANPPLALVLRPLGATLGITVTFGGLRGLGGS